MPFFLIMSETRIQGYYVTFETNDACKHVLASRPATPDNRLSQPEYTSRFYVSCVKKGVHVGWIRGHLACNRFEVRARIPMIFLDTEPRGRIVAQHGSSNLEKLGVTRFTFPELKAQRSCLMDIDGNPAFSIYMSRVNIERIAMSIIARDDCPLPLDFEFFPLRVGPRGFAPPGKNECSDFSHTLR